MKKAKDAIVHECAMGIMYSVLRFFHSWLDEMKKIKNQFCDKIPTFLGQQCPTVVTQSSDLQ